MWRLNVLIREKPIRKTKQSYETERQNGPLAGAAIAGLQRGDENGFGGDGAKIDTAPAH